MEWKGKIFWSDQDANYIPSELVPCEYSFIALEDVKVLNDGQFIQFFIPHKNGLDRSYLIVLNNTGVRYTQSVEEWNIDCEIFENIGRNKIILYGDWKEHKNYTVIVVIEQIIP